MKLSLYVDRVTSRKTSWEIWRESFDNIYSTAGHTVHALCLSWLVLIVWDCCCHKTLPSDVLFRVWLRPLGVGQIIHCHFSMWEEFRNLEMKDQEFRDPLIHWALSNPTHPPFFFDLLGVLGALSGALSGASAPLYGAPWFGPITWVSTHNVLWFTKHCVQMELSRQCAHTNPFFCFASNLFHWQHKISSTQFLCPNTTI